MMIPEVVTLGKRISEVYKNAQVWELTDLGKRRDAADMSMQVTDGDIAPYQGVRLYVTGAQYPGEVGNQADVDIQLVVRTDAVSMPYTLVGFLSRYPLVHGPITLDFSGPNAELGGAEATINATMACERTYPAEYVPVPSPTDLICIEFVDGEAFELREVYEPQIFQHFYQLAADEPDRIISGITFTAAPDDPYDATASGAPAEWLTTQPMVPMPNPDMLRLWRQTVTSNPTDLSQVSYGTVEELGATD